VADKTLYSEHGIFGRLDYGGPGVSRGLVHAASISSLPYIKRIVKKVLIVGGGNNYEAVWFFKNGYKVFAIDLRIPKIKCLKGKCTRGSASELPFKSKSFDLVFCSEMLEHVPEEEVDDILRETMRVGKKVYFTIATRDDKPFNTHINIHDALWWINRFMENGFEIVTASMNPVAHIFLNRGLISMVYPDGVCIYADC
jgi:hypothetical protein